jgi:ribose 5-phosphate isomerase RpiB
MNRSGEELLSWPDRIVTAEGLAHHLNGHRELLLPPGAVITPSAFDWLRGKGIQLSSQLQSKTATPGWGWAQEKESLLVRSAVTTLEREKIAVQDLPGIRGSLGDWAKEVAACVAAGQCQGGVVFCTDAALFCCVANKIPGLRAAAVSTVLHAARATLTMGANLLAVEMPGRTFFEIRQILKTACTTGTPSCPAELARTLRELDGHAHR